MFSAVRRFSSSSMRLLSIVRSSSAPVSLDCIKTYSIRRYAELKVLCEQHLRQNTSMCT